MATNNNTTTTSSWGTNALDLNTSSQSKQELNNMVENEELPMEEITVARIDLSEQQEVSHHNNDLLQRSALAQSQPTQGHGADIFQGGIQQSKEGNQPHLPSSELSTASSLSKSSSFLAPIIPVITPAMDSYMAKKYYELHGNDKKILGAMATGIVDPNDLEGRTISFDREPYLSYGKKNEFTVTKTNLTKEITR